MIDCKTCEYEKVCEIPDFVRNDMKSCKTYTQKKPFTNAERIRKMSISDLASFLCKVKADYQWVEQDFPPEDEAGAWEEWLNEILSREERENE